MTRKINLILLCIAVTGISCIGSRIYFNKDTRYEIKYAMKIIKHHFEIVRTNLNQNPPRVNIDENITGIDKMDTASESLESFSESQNMKVFRTTLGKTRDILKFLKESIETGKEDRALYNFKRLNNQCIACHTRYRVGIHI